ncbi:hypothetical protein SAICODRAFT_25454 [Saitoella complicata NRRL Y-17804]|uniref:uncharacterized protein n=1 Tax=Saitoella complicata (strain BCRC 22490 / CBS 7301 / JCM 7358 / NBRC 10748 / NRRL Y-17804) TaxID=698492 RepID=UPI0008675D7F|nr:uncharacterized protein SAICODRAFT_25454 [Saitoella complicata NRRL Y-17804]ODQ52929.1 hypothetical protein SAICODRAFT_25454 [Saitoella complicata NRRL Y-17804]
MSSITHAIRSDFTALFTNSSSMDGDTTSPIRRDFSFQCDREQASPISAIMNYTPPTSPRCQSPVAATRKPTSAGDSEHSEAEADAVSALQMMMLLRTPPKEKTDSQFFPTDGDHSDCESHSGSSESEYDIEEDEDDREDPQIVERRLSATLRKRLYGSSTAPSDDEDEDEAYNVPKRRISYAHAYPDTAPDIASWRDRLRRQQPSVKSVTVPRPVPIKIVSGMNARVERERAIALTTPVVTKKQGPMSYPMTPAPSHEAEPVVSSSRMRRTSSSSSTTSPTTPHHRSSITTTTASTFTSNRTCAACRASQTPCWRPGFTPGTWLCNSCGLRYKKTGVRCVNEDCCYLPVRTEWREMKLGSAGGKGGMRCLQCGGEVKVRGG